MNRLALSVFAVAIAFPGFACAHPGHHAGGEFAAWLRHMLLSPDHLPALIVAGLAIGLGVVLIDRRAERRHGRSAQDPDPGRTWRAQRR